MQSQYRALHYSASRGNKLLLLLLGGELLTERCRTDDLMPDLPVPSLPPCRMDPKVLGLDVLIDCSEPGSDT